MKCILFLLLLQDVKGAACACVSAVYRRGMFQFLSLTVSSMYRFNVWGRTIERHVFIFTATAAVKEEEVELQGVVREEEMEKEVKKE